MPLFSLGLFEKLDQNYKEFKVPSKQWCFLCYSPQSSQPHQSVDLGYYCVHPHSTLFANFYGKYILVGATLDNFRIHILLQRFLQLSRNPSIKSWPVP